ncbi:hypothetical protein [Thiobacillus sp.]|nr:hypothetical protein [Thiobacillus sp.]
MTRYLNMMLRSVLTVREHERVIDYPTWMIALDRVGAVDSRP